MLTRFLFCCAAAIAGDIACAEERTFNLTVDGKSAGTYVMKIEAHDDGTTTVTCKADISVKILLVRYTYTYRGDEVWKDGKLVSLNGTCNDDGKRTAVSLVAGKEGYTLKAGAKAVAVKSSVWPTSYWKLPDEKAREGSMTLVDADTGRVLQAKIEKVGVERPAGLDQDARATRYHLSGGAVADLWYDGADRLVKQAWVEDGHKTVMTLAGLKKD